MSRLQRMSLTGTALLMSVVAVLVLTYAGSSAQGPLARVLTVAGNLVSSAESQVVAGYRGPQRSKELTWFAPYRTNPWRLRNPDEVLLGAYDGQMPGSIEGVIKLEKVVGTTFPLVQFYTAWGDKPEHQFPSRLARAISELGSVPVVTWEPWLAAFDARDSQLPPAEERDKGGLAAVTEGKYDFYIDRWAADAAQFGKPLFVRFGHEMNDPYRYPWGPQNNNAEEFISAWRHVVERFRLAGADNVLWIWSPHISHEGYEHYYPGDDVVDWIAATVLNYGSVAYWSQWWTFEEIFGQKYEYLAGFGKPIMLAEFGTIAVGGDRSAWFEAALADLPSRHPQVRAVLFFHSSYDTTVTKQALDWTFAKDPAVASTVRSAIHAW